MDFAALALAGLLSFGAVQDPVSSPQQPPIDEQEADLGTIEVFGSVKAKANAFIAEATQPPRGRRLARWDDGLCVRVVNMDERYAQFMIDRISAMAADVGLRPGGPRCHPNVFVIATDDGAGMAKYLSMTLGENMRPARGVSDRGRNALRTFETSEAPVRWWHISAPFVIESDELALGGNVRVFSSSRIRATTREDIVNAAIILDMKRIGPIQFGALSDYVGMVALAQIDPEANLTSHDTVLNLFATTERTAVMSDWDRDFLGGMYGASRDRIRSGAQTGSISRIMVDRQQGRPAEIETP